MVVVMKVLVTGKEKVVVVELDQRPWVEEHLLHPPRPRSTVMRQ